MYIAQHIVIIISVIEVEAAACPPTAARRVAALLLRRENQHLHGVFFLNYINSKITTNHSPPSLKFF
jgi:hypothetical protein